MDIANQQASTMPRIWMNATPMPTPIRTTALLPTRSSSFIRHPSCVEVFVYYWLIQKHACFNTNLKVFDLIGRCIFPAILANHIDHVHMAAARPERFILAVVRPVCRSIYATAHQLALHIVPSHYVGCIRTHDGLLKRFLKHRLQIGLVDACRNATRHFDDENEAQQKRELAQVDFC